jgi:hypothetical protein
MVDGRSGLVSPRRQAKMRSNRPRSRKASGIIDTDFERTGRNGTDARHSHQPPANRIMLNDLQEHSMQSFVALEDRPPHFQHGLNR